MGEFSIWHWLLVLLVVLLLFGGGKLSGLMGDLAKGIRAFKQNIAEDAHPARDATAARPPDELLPGPADRAASAAAAEARREDTAVH